MWAVKTCHPKEWGPSVGILIDETARRTKAEAISALADMMLPLEESGMTRERLWRNWKRRGSVLVRVRVVEGK